MRKTLFEIESEKELIGEINQYRKNSKEISKLEDSISEIVQQIKDKSKGENTRLKQIINYMQDFKVNKVKADKWVAELENVTKYTSPQPSYKGLWEEALSKLNKQTVLLLKQLEHTQVASKAKETEPKLTITENIFKQGLDKLKALFLSFKSYDTTVKNLPPIKQQEEMKNQPLNEQFQRMQKLAGINEVAFQRPKDDKNQGPFDDCYVEGKKAFIVQQPIEDNPYEENSMEWDQWKTGWEDASKGETEDDGEDFDYDTRDQELEEDGIEENKTINENMNNKYSLTRLIKESVEEEPETKQSIDEDVSTENFDIPDEIGKFFIVAKPISKDSQLIDVLFESDVFHFANQVRSGLKMEDVRGLFKSKPKATKLAKSLLKEFDDQLEEVEGAMDEFRTHNKGLDEKRKAAKEKIMSIKNIGKEE